MMRPRILITAGPTHEPIDAVRYIGNRSSGRMGIALCEAASRLSLPATLLLGPIESPVLPESSPRDAIRFRTGADLQALLLAHWPTHDILLMAAAVADFRPIAVAEGKIRREGGPLSIGLEPVPDLLAECARRGRRDQVLIGFALEPDSQLAEHASRKVREKGIDAIVANPLATMGSEKISATLVFADGSTQAPPGRTLWPKLDFGVWLVNRAVVLWEAKQISFRGEESIPARQF